MYSSRRVEASVPYSGAVDSERSLFGQSGIGGG